MKNNKKYFVISIERTKFVNCKKTVLCQKNYLNLKKSLKQLEKENKKTLKRK